MVFSSLTFLYMFLPAVILLFFCVPKKFGNAVLLGASLIFYFCGERLYLLLMLGEIALTYFSALFLDRTDGKARKAVLTVFVILSFSLLGLFKYADLIPGTINAITGQERIKLLALPLPIGISFYVFQSVSYCIDVYRRKYPAEKNPLNLALYVSFFPQLIAGPIVRFETVRSDLRTRERSLENASEGLFRFTIGLGKKVLIADRLFAFCEAAANAAAPSVILSWAQALAFLLYVYFDFSGYSDMAIGLARCFGFSLPENFEYPLISTSFREFWRRWHISLGSWFRDYLYIPLGGSRVKLGKHIRNLMVVWALTGLWHGASWNFVLWGLGFGILLTLEVLFEKKFPKKDRDSSNRLTDILKAILVLALTMLLFVWFRFTDLTMALSEFKNLFGAVPFWTGETAYLLGGAGILFAISLFGATPLPKKLSKRAFGALPSLPRLKALTMLTILAFATAYLVDGSFSPFLYFRF